MRKPTWRESVLISVALLMAAGSVYIIGANYHWWPTIQEPDWVEDWNKPESIRNPDARSEDLQSDIQLMWETDENEYGSMASTTDAIDAANRVFNSVELVGKTGAEVKEILGSPINSNDSVYRGSPFWPIESRALVYRFDNGSFGWQITIYCQGDDEPVTKVEKLWIH